MDLTLVRVRATRHFPRSSRLRPFVGFAALIDNARVEGGVGTTIGVSVEPGLYLELFDNLRLFVELPLGVVKPIDISWSDEAGTTLTTPIDPLFGGSLQVYTSAGASDPSPRSSTSVPGTKFSLVADGLAEAVHIARVR